jgi:hypothetical protein
MKNLCSWEYLEIGKTYEIEEYAYLPTVFSRGNKSETWHLLLLEKQKHKEIQYAWIYTFLTKSGLKKLAFYYNDDIWFFEVDNPEIVEQ